MLFHLGSGAPVLSAVVAGATCFVDFDFRGPLFFGTRLVIPISSSPLSAADASWSSAFFLARFAFGFVEGAVLLSSLAEESTSAYVRLVAFRVDFRVDMVMVVVLKTTGAWKCSLSMSGDGDMRRDLIHVMQHSINLDGDGVPH